MNERFTEFTNAEFMGELRQAIQDAGYDSIRYANEVENTFGDVADLTPAARARKNAIGREINAIDEAERARAPAMPDVSSLPEDEIDAALNQWLEAGKVKRYTPDEAARREALLAESMEIERTGRGDPYSYIALDDSQLRSVNAAFDPAQRDSSNLLAGLGGAAVGAGLLAPQEAEAGFSSAGARELLKRGKDAFMGSPRITRDANAADLRPRAGASAMRAEPEPFLDRYTVRHGESGSTVFDGDRPVASYDAFNTLVVDPEYRREGIASELIAQRRTMFPDQPPATERTRGAQAAQESAWRRIERGAEGFARPGAMAATGAAGALASFLDMRSGKQDTPYKRFIAEGQRAVEQAIGAGENIGNLAASILAEPIAGYAGLVAGPEAVQRTRDYFAPQSMSPAAQQQMIGLGNTLESAGQQIMSGLDAAGQAVGVDRLSDYARYAPGYWEQRVVPALQRQFGTRAGSALAAMLRAAPEAL